MSSPPLRGTNYDGTDPGRRPRPHFHGPSVGTIPDPIRRARYMYESEPERAVLTVLASQSWVRRIREQVKVDYSWEGSKRSYFVDVVADDQSGRRIAFAVRQFERDFHRDDTLAILNAISRQHGRAMADEFRAVAYETLDPVAVLNGRTILRCARDRDEHAQAVVHDALASLGRQVTLREIARWTGLKDRAVRAAIATFATGSLMNPRGTLIELDLQLENRAAKKR